MTKVFVAKNAFCDKTYFVAIYFFRNEKKSSLNSIFFVAEYVFCNKNFDHNMSNFH